MAYDPRGLRKDGKDAARGAHWRFVFHLFLSSFKQVSNLLASLVIVLECGEMHTKLWGRPGYDDNDPLSWCTAGRKSLNPMEFALPPDRMPSPLDE